MKILGPRLECKIAEDSPANKFHHFSHILPSIELPSSLTSTSSKQTTRGPIHLGRVFFRRSLFLIFAKQLYHASPVFGCSVLMAASRHYRGGKFLFIIDFSMKGQDLLSEPKTVQTLSKQSLHPRRTYRCAEYMSPSQVYP